MKRFNKLTEIQMSKQNGGISWPTVASVLLVTTSGIGLGSTIANTVYTGK